MTDKTAEEKIAERYDAWAAEGEEEIRKLCHGDPDTQAAAIRIWRRDGGRTTPRIAVYSAKRVYEMAQERKNGKR